MSDTTLFSEGEDEPRSPEVSLSMSMAETKVEESQNSFSLQQHFADLSQLLPVCPAPPPTVKKVKVSSKADTYTQGDCILDHALTRLPQIALTASSLNHLTMTDLRVLLTYKGQAPGQIDQSRQPSTGTGTYLIAHVKQDKRKLLELVLALYRAGQFEDDLNELKNRQRSNTLVTPSQLTSTTALNGTGSITFRNPAPALQLTKSAAVAPTELRPAAATASPLLQPAHVATPSSAPRLQRPGMVAPLQCILGEEDDWIAVDTDTRQALERNERILCDESRKEQKLDEYDMSSEYSCSYSERESDTCGGGGGANGSSEAGGQGKVFLCNFQKNEWEAVSEEESAILSFDHPAFAPLQVLQRQQEARRFSLLQESATATRGAAISVTKKEEDFKEKMKAELKQRVQEHAASKRSRESADNVSVPHPSEAAAAQIDYTELFKNYLASHLNALLPAIAGTAALATETDSSDVSPRMPTTPTGSGHKCAPVSEQQQQKKFSTPEYLLAHNIHNFSEELVPCQHVTTQTDQVSTGVKGMLQSVDPLQLPSKAVKLLCFHEARLGLVLASVPRAQGGDENKTIVRAKIGEHIDAELAKYVNIGDELVSISGHDMKSLPYAQQVTTIATSKRPIVLGFISSN